MRAVTVCSVTSSVGEKERERLAGLLRAFLRSNEPAQSFFLLLFLEISFFFNCAMAVLTKLVKTEKQM